MTDRPALLRQAVADAHPGPAAASATPAGMLHPERLAARPVLTTLAVRDLGAVRAFYQQVIGLVPLAEEAGRVVLGVTARPMLELLHRPDAVPDRAQHAGLFHNAFLLPSRSWLGAWLIHATRAGVRMSGAADHLVSEAIYLDDPEGNGVEMYADRPQADWTWRNGEVRMSNAMLDAPGLVAAGAGLDWSAAPAGTVLGHVHLRTGDAAAAGRFYAGLGFAPTLSTPQAVFLGAGGYHHHLAVNAWSSAGAGMRPEGMAGFLGLTLEAVDGPEEAVRDPWGLLLRRLPA